MPDILVRLALLVLAGVFAWSAAVKAIRLPEWRRSLARYRFPPALAAAALPGAPVAELAVAVLLVAGPARVGAALAVALLAGFCLAVMRARRLEGDRLPCGCFGSDKASDFRTILARNAFLALLSLIVLVRGEDVALLHGAGAPVADELLPAALVVTGGLVAVWVALAVTSSFRKG